MGVIQPPGLEYRELKVTGDVGVTIQKFTTDETIWLEAEGYWFEFSAAENSADIAYIGLNQANGDVPATLDKTNCLVDLLPGGGAMLPTTRTMKENVEQIQASKLCAKVPNGDVVRLIYAVRT